MDTKGIIEAIKAGFSGIHIQGQDFLRMDKQIGDLAKELNFKHLEWNHGYGWVNFKNKQPLKPNTDVSLYEDLRTIADANPTRTLFVIKSVHTALQSDLRAVARLQQELLRIRRSFCGQSAIILISKEAIDLPDITDLIVTFRCMPLASDQVAEVLETFRNEHKVSINTEVNARLISICSGMEHDMVVRVLNMLKNSHGTKFSDRAIDDALSMKKQLLAQSGLIELIDLNISIDEIGGLEQLKSWLQNKKYIMNDLSGASRVGIAIPKGVLLAGMPGCGKSMSAKATASLFQVPLLRLDVGSIMGKYVGESEANMKAALQIAEKASPCVLWIDELEKAFSGVNGSGGSTEITTRLFGYFLTWMQEKPGAVFVVATANDITTLPPELLRRGRFDEIFYIDLPEERERQQIFRVLAEKLPTSPRGLDFAALAEATGGFSGADIECVINDALEKLFRQRAELNQMALEQQIRLTTPISVVLKKKIDDYRETFKQYKLKSASFSKEKPDDLKNRYASSDPSARENAAASDVLAADQLINMVSDPEERVRKAALKNPHCPIEALKKIVDGYHPFDFRQTGVWSNRISKEERLLALQHPNMSGAIILELYARGKLAGDLLLLLADKLSSEEKALVFDKIKVKLSRSIRFSDVKKISCVPMERIKTGEILVEIDDEQGSTMSISAPSSGWVTEICVRPGDHIESGATLARMMVLKNQ